MIEWIKKKAQKSRLLEVIQRALGPSAAEQEVAQEWRHFEARLSEICRKYKPSARCRFWDYLAGCAWDIAEPPHLRPIFDLPGKEWLKDEEKCGKVKEWLEKERKAGLLTYAICILYFPEKDASEQAKDVEDAWHSFIQKKLQSVIGLYDPEIARFWGYLKYVTFKRFCLDERRRLQALVQNRQDLADLVKTNVDVPDYLKTSTVTDPSKILEQAEHREILLSLVKQLEPPYREVAWMYYIQDKDHKEIASVIGITEGHSRIRLHRAKFELIRMAARLYLMEMSAPWRIMFVWYYEYPKVAGSVEKILELEGTLLRLSAANWSQDVVLERKTLDQLGARVVISAEKLEQLPDNAELRVAV